MTRLESIDVNTVAKAKRILAMLKASGRRGWYETFYDFDGAFYCVYYRTKEV